MSYKIQKENEDIEYKIDYLEPNIILNAKIV